ncbi:MAG: hypothetical protein B6245_07800 [Desulfobacteraceae bacterium 4572_88]|nr:MAG: hypothetical protein B6245_07800 [Desulfobacteraceae bacterium 4572_88]
MGKDEKKEESSLDMDNTSSVLIARREGIFIKKGESRMATPEEKSNRPIPIEKANTDRAKEMNSPQKDSADTEGATTENIDKIRDLIFGNQMHDYEKRFSRLEERMFKEMTVSKSEARENYDSLEKTVTRELESLKDQVVTEQSARSEAIRKIERQLEDISRALKDQITGEQNARSESLRNLERQFRDMNRSFGKETDRIKEESGRSAEAFQQQISEQSQNLRAEIRQKYEETASAMERMAQELRTNKMDRVALSSFFNEMAMRIVNEKG